MIQTIQTILIYSCTGISGAIVAFTLSKRYLTSIDEVVTQREGISAGSLKEYLTPMGELLRFKAASSDFISSSAKKYDTLILQAGSFWGGLNGYEVLASKFILPPVFFTLISFLGLLAGLELDIVILAAMFFSIFLYMYPDSILEANAKKRQKLFMSQLPGALDILKVAADAGLDFHSSISYLVDIYIPGPIKEEMIIFRRELKLGIPSITALTNITHRINVPEASTVFISLSQSIEMGTSIVEMLESTTREMRRKRLLSAETEAQKAVVKISFPLLLLILPGIFIILLAPVLKPMLSVFGTLGQ